MKKKNVDISAGSWILIIVLFATGLWPIALAYLLYKLLGKQKTRRSYSKTKVSDIGATRVNSADESETPSPAKKKTVYILLIVFGGLLGLGGMGAVWSAVDMIIWLGEIESYYIEDIISGLAFIIVGFVMICKGVSISRAMKRYKKYLAVIGSRTAVPTANMVSTLGYSKRQVEKDFENMVEENYFGPGAYYNLELDCLFIDGIAETAWREQQKKAEAVPEVEDAYSAILRELRNANDRIEDPVLSAKIERLEGITAKIFRAVESDPEKKKRIDTFLNYYLPTTQKLLDSYAEFEDAGVDGENLRQAKARIETTMDNIISGFEHQLDELYKFDALDIDTDIQVLETMMTRQGLTKQGSMADAISLEIPDTEKTGLDQ